MFPGDTEFTRTPCAASSTASAFVKAVIAPLVATYVVAWSCPITATRLETLMMLPRVRRRCGRARRQATNTLITFSSNSPRDTAGAHASIGFGGGGATPRVAQATPPPAAAPRGRPQDPPRPPPAPRRRAEEGRPPPPP